MNMLKRKTIILPIGGGGTPEIGTLNIVSEGTYDVSRYAEVNVDIPYTDDYFCLTTLSNNSSFYLYNRNQNNPNIEYSFDKINWTTWDYSELTLEHVNTDIYFRGNNPNGFTKSLSNTSSFIFTAGTFAVSGNIMTLLSHESELPLTDYCFNRLFAQNNVISGAGLVFADALELPATTLTQFCYANMFSNCTSLSTAPTTLPATTLAQACYNNMFFNCTSLSTAPTTLPATTLAENCYYGMFSNCEMLITAPSLPATTLAANCYYGMFSKCIGLATAPSLPATTLAANCYKYMFRGCTGLTTTPSLPATTLAQSCYNNMFYDCTSLVNAPALPATTLAKGCYSSMFQGCTGLTTTPVLPATTLAENCYQYMFRGCTRLTTTPSLPATTLAKGCYSGMFYDCTSLVNALSLPATTLADNCYQNMFYRCTSLTTAPEIMATSFDVSAAPLMFNGCSSLNEITVNVTTWVDQTNWVNGVAQNGNFNNFGNATIPTGNNGIPTGWVEHKANYLYFEDITGSQNTLTLTKTNTGGLAPTVNLEYSTDGQNWTTWEEINNVRTYNIPANGKVYIRGNNIAFGQGSNNTDVHTFSSTGDIEAHGNIMTLLDKTGQSVSFTTSGTFKSLFKDWTHLKTAPELPATNLSNSCYASMFQGCTEISDIPYLPAAILTRSCYVSMFQGCTSLVNAQDLPANTLNNSCYYQMFQGCTSLVNGPEIVADTMDVNSFYRMFRGCSSLNNVKTYITNWDSNNSSDWLDGVSSTGDFYNLGQATISTGNSGIPTGWTEHTSIPVTFLSYIHKDTLENQVDSGAVVTDKINTLIAPNGQNYSFRLKGKYKGYRCGTILAGVMDQSDINTGDCVKFRFFSYAGQKYFDCGSHRYNSASFSIDEEVDVTVSNCSCYNNLTQSNIYSGSTQTLQNYGSGYTFLADCSTWWLKSLEIFDENGNTVFNGVAAVENGVYGLWDSVTNSMFTNSTINIVGEA